MRGFAVHTCNPSLMSEVTVHPKLVPSLEESGGLANASELLRENPGSLTDGIDRAQMVSLVS